MGRCASNLRDGVWRSVEVTHYSVDVCLLVENTHIYYTLFTARIHGSMAGAQEPATLQQATMGHGRTKSVMITA